MLAIPASRKNSSHNPTLKPFLTFPTRWAGVTYVESIRFFFFSHRKWQKRLKNRIKVRTIER
jgi:hypothetical protein